MSEWKNPYAKIETDLVSVGLLFKSGKVKRMYDIAELFPTKISKLLGMNSERYSVKLSSPEKFSLSEILCLSYIINTDPNLIIEVIQKETELVVMSRIKKIS
jgi:hypothetical protein